MRLTAKLVLVFVLGMFVVMTLYGFVTVQHEVRKFEQDSVADARRIGSAMEEMITVVWREKGEDGVLQMIRRTEHQEPRMQIRWVWFDVPSGHPCSPVARQPGIQALVVKQQRTITVADPDGNDRLEAYWPIPVEGNRKGGLELSRSLAELKANKREAIYETLTLSAGMFLMSGLMATFCGIRFVGRPLEQLITKTRRIGHGDLDGPIDLRTHDELSELARTINDMCVQLAASRDAIQAEATARVAAVDQLRHADRLRTVGRLASGVAHELGTPLNVVSGRAGLIASGKLSEPDVIQSANTIRAESDRMASIIQKLLDFARRSLPQRTETNLRHVATHTMDLLEALASKADVTLTLDADDRPFPAQVDVGQIQQVLSNLIVNAVQSMPDGGQVTIDLTDREAVPPDDLSASPRAFCCMTVQDQGVGIAPEDREQMFEPFFTTKDVGEGTGLGLSISYGIVQEHGGWIDVESELGKGSLFLVYLPVA